MWHRRKAKKLKKELGGAARSSSEEGAQASRLASKVRLVAEDFQLPLVPYQGRFQELAEEDEEDGEEVGVMAAEEEQANAVVEVTVDSGAGRNVWPKTQKTAGKMLPLKKKVRLIAANGTNIEVLGEKTIMFKKGDGRKCGMRYLITSVKKPLAAVSSIVDEGNRVVFDTDDSYVECKATGERIPLKRKNGTFVMELEVEMEKAAGRKTPSDKMDVGRVSQGAQGSQKLFQRQA